MKVNAKKTTSTKNDRHLNWMDGGSYFLSDPIQTLRLAAASCFFGEPMYYHSAKDSKTPRASAGRLATADSKRLRETLMGMDPQDWRGLSPAELMVSAIDKALDFDPERTLALAAELRSLHYIRTTPQIILVRAAHHPKVRGTGLIRLHAPGILLRADEPATGLAYQLSEYGVSKPIPNSLKKAWAEALVKASGYQLAKYRMEDREVKTVDVVNLVHAHSSAINLLMKDKLRNTDQTWEAIISKNGSTLEAWTDAVEVMGHMALLRNLRNLQTAKVPTALYLDKLKAGVADGKQLPFRYYSAYNALRDVSAGGPVLDAVEECLTLSLGNMPKLPGRVMSLCDNSGSAWGAMTSEMGSVEVAKIGNLSGVIAGSLADEGYLGVFGNQLEVMPVRKKASVFDQVDRACKVGRERVGQDTEHGIWLFWDKAIREEEHWDHVFVFSDQQAGHGGLYGTNPALYADYTWQSRYIDVSKLVNTYRSRVNPKVNVYLVQVAGYQDTILPEYYKRTYILGGWGAGIFKFAHEMSQLMDHVDAQQPKQ